MIGENEMEWIVTIIIAVIIICFGISNDARKRRKITINKGIKTNARCKGYRIY